MFQRIIIALSFVLFLAGCVTTTPTPKNQAQQLQEQVRELQDKIYFLEQELQAKGREISELEIEIEKTRGIESSSRQKTKIAPVTNLSIRQIQTALKNAGFYKGVVDGKLGAQTKSAIKKFQKSKGLRADGIVGKKTTIALSKYLTK